MSWIGAIIAGAIAGWVAEKIMKADHGLLVNIVLGILGAMVFNALLGVFGIAAASGFWASILVGIAGACLLIWGWRKIGRRS